MQNINTVYWENDGDIIIRKEDGYVTTNSICAENNVMCNQSRQTFLSNNSLTINHATEEYIGKYKCVVIYDVDECSTLHTLYPKSNVSKEMTNITFETGDDVTFDCDIQVRIYKPTCNVCCDI